MYNQCPKCHYQRQPDDAGPTDRCLNCGLIFSKWIKHRFRRETDDTIIKTEMDHGLGLLRRLLSPQQEKTGTVVLMGRSILFALLFVWGWQFILMEMESNEIGNSFMHTVNLVFHEAGHVIFHLLGNLMMTLGGSLMQILVPLVVGVTFLFKHNNLFGASVALWWAGQSMMDIAPYINDARARQLPLLGGGDGMDRPWMHDWYNILGDMDLLHRDHFIATLVDTLGELTVMLALAWGGYILYQQFIFRATRHS